MRKTIVITALALGLGLGTVNASPLISSSENYNVEKVTTFEVSPFCVSIAKGDVDTVKKLISLGEDINKKSNGMTPLMYAAKFNRVEILNILVANGAKLKSRCDRGHTALKYAQMSQASEASAILKNLTSRKKKK